MNEALQALHAVDFEWTTHIDTIWRDVPYDVPELQEALRKEALLQLERLFMSKTSASPLGMVLAGSGGSGKTHLLSLLRQAVLKRGAFFVLVDMTDVRDFWEITLQGYFRSLNQSLSDGPTQLDRLLTALVEKAQSKVTAQQLKRGRPPGLINHCNALLAALRRQHPDLQAHQDVLRALVLFGSDDDHQRNLGWQWLQALGMSEEERLMHGFYAPSAAPREVVRGISFLMGLVGPTLLALDQLDAIVAEQHLASAQSQEPVSNERSTAALAIIQGIAKGLIALRDTTSRTQTVVACLEQTWSVLDQRALVTMRDRFLPPLALRPVVEASQVQRLVELRLMTAYESTSFKPPYPSYPFKSSYFATLAGASPREVLKRCDEHRWNCLRAGEVTELLGPVPGPQPPPDREPDFKLVRAKFQELHDKADPSKLIANEDEDALDKLLEAACRALVAENRVPEDVDVLLDEDFPGPGSYAPLHARVRVVYRAESEREKHYAVRFLQKKHHHAFQARIKAAMTASGIDHNLPFRKLVLFRAGAVPAGAQTTTLVAELQSRGGSFAEPSIDELKTLSALAQMFADPKETPRLRDWLRAEPIVSRLPTFAETAEYLFGDVSKRSKLPPPPAPVAPDATEPNQGGSKHIKTTKAEPTHAPDPFETRLFVGHKLVGGAPKDPLFIETENLAKHTVVLAGAGSGKTVLVRRIIEEAALLGIPSIVIDGANDLSRLGDPWPEPSPFSGVDREKAQRYQDKAEVVIWTPGREAGNPLLLEPLPDFADVATDPDDMQAALYVPALRHLSRESRRWHE
jgi:hypothetical protein